MDEILFRSGQSLENLQIKTHLALERAKDALVVITERGNLLLLELWNYPAFLDAKTNMNSAALKMISSVKELKVKIISYANPKQMYIAFINIFGKKWTTRDICFACSGLVIGGIIGFTIGLTIRKKEPVLRYMQAIQCNNYLGPESIIVAEDAFAPCECSEYDVLVNVKAASVQMIDLQICSGYGKTLRRLLQQSRPDLPIILGRDCAGIITDIGSKVTRLEVGDEVWLSVPFWCQGTLCQSMLVCENRVTRKPKNIGFEGACSLPYSGSLALSALAEARLEPLNARQKRVLVQGGCTPVGCVLIQLLSHWQAEVSATCYQRAIPVVKALGASNMIVLTEVGTPNEKSVSETERREQNNAYLKELESAGEVFDVIIKTGVECDLDTRDFSNFLKTDGTIISTLPPLLTSDSYGVFRRFMLSFYIYLKYKLQDVLGLPKNDFDETHLCYVTLDRLTEFVEDGYLQTVVDKIYHPHDIEIALNHIQNPNSIGSTVITFR